MKFLRQLVLWLVLAVIAGLAVLSISGAFLGAERAKTLFNSVPMVAYWLLLALLLVAGFVFFRRLITRPAGLAMHVGSLLVLGGAMWGSDQAHALRTALFGTGSPVAEALGAVGPGLPGALRWLGADKIPSGYLVVEKGQAASRVLDQRFEEVVGELPFSVYLENFWIEYYPPRDPRWFLVVVAPVLDADGNVVHEHEVEIPWAVGREVRIPHTRVGLQVLEYQAGDPPAMEVLLKFEGRERRAWLRPKEGEPHVALPLAPLLVEMPKGEPPPTDREGPTLYLVAPAGDIRAYKSDLSVLVGAGRAVRRTIEVNDPLHYGGYHFYQADYDHQAGRYTVLKVVSDSGLGAVWLGFALVVGGAFGRFWGTAAWGCIRGGQAAAPQGPGT